MPDDDPYRLPRSVIPKRYDLDLVVDPAHTTFSGTVVIATAITTPVDRIVLNSVGLDLADVTVTDAEGATLRPEVVRDEPAERVHLLLDRELRAGDGRIEITFSGSFCEDLVGLYRSTFTVDGEEHHLAVTQFESTHARRAFPCFDEPDMKAVFGISLVVPDGMLAVSNAGEHSRGPASDGMVRVRFADTVVMSTYLVAAVVGHLSSTDARMVEGMSATIPLRVICPPGSAHLGGFALDVAEEGIRFLERYYDLPYPGDKVDLVAIPDFAFGAMENLGCITFREVALLVDPNDVTQPELQRVADVVNHELAHMWFGDLVTMEWWNGIWLNEAFATFMEVTASDAFRPSWSTWTSFGLARAAAFDTDALPSTRPIEFPVHSPADAEAMFDILTYEKGASVLRMLEQYLGAERFRDGIRSYLRTHAHGNTDTTDLWDDLEESLGEPIRRTMDAWIDQGGHPVVAATATDTGIRLDQVPATIDVTSRSRPGDGLPGTTQPATWPVPLVVTATVDGVVRRERVLLDGTVEIDLGGPPSAVRINTGGDGFFRTRLPRRWRAVEAVDPTASPLERFVLLDDTWSGLLRGEIGVDTVEEVIRLLTWRETDPSVWRRVAHAVRDLRRLAPGSDERWRSLAVDIAARPLDGVEVLLDAGSPGDAERWCDLRGVLFGLMGIHGRAAGVQALAQELFHSPPEEARGRHGVDSELLVAALEIVAATGTATDHAVIERRWRASTNPQETIRYLYALADTPLETCFEHLLELALDEVRAQDAAYVLRRALTHPRLPDRAWATVSGRWEEVIAKIPSSAVVRMLEGIRTITDPLLAEQIEEFTSAHPTPGGTRILAQHLERMWVNVDVATRLRVEPGGAVGDASPTARTRA